MKSFGRLLRRLRGETPLREIATRTKMDVDDLADLEGGRRTADEVVARRILVSGLKMDRRDAARAILGIQLYDLGLRDNDFRQLTLDVISKELPRQTREEIRHLYRRFADGEPGQAQQPTSQAPS